MPTRNDLDAIKKLLRDIADRHQDERDAVAEILKFVDRAGAAVDERNRQAPRRTGDETRYIVETVNKQQFLGEYRPRSQVLKIGHDLYGAVMTALSHAERPLHFDELMDQVEQRASMRPAEWQVRVAMRFLLRARPALLQRSRSRYLPTDRKQFARAAEAWWKANARG